MSYTPLGCEQIVLRAILSRRWLDEEGRITPDAFIRRHTDLDGLSVNILSLTPVDQWLASFRNSFGADSLHPGKIRALAMDLDVGQQTSGVGTQSAHASIIGVPHQDEDPQRAERIASALSRISRLHDRTPRKHRER